MLPEPALRHAIDLQRRSYRLFRWMADAVTRGFIQFDTGHDYATLPDAAEAWVTRHFADLPPDARPAIEDIVAFAAVFTTYLRNSFELIRSPEKHTNAPSHGCPCPVCRWGREPSNLRTRRVRSSDRRRARVLREGAVLRVAADEGIILADAAVARLVDDPALREATALSAWAQNLLDRAQGLSSGPAILVLWREFAWTPAGSPKKGFEVTADAVLAAETTLRDAVVAAHAAE